MTDLVTCEQCGTTVERKRVRKRNYCSPRCRKAASRAPLIVTDTSLPTRSAYGAQRHAPAVPETPSAHGSNPDGSTPGALQGDDYPLEYYDDGFPKLPAFLDRRVERPRQGANDLAKSGEIVPPELGLEAA